MFKNCANFQTEHRGIPDDHLGLNVNDEENTGLDKWLEMQFEIWTNERENIGGISFADFMNAAACIATRILVTDDVLIYDHPVSYYTQFNYGRTDCSTAPYTDIDHCCQRLT